MKKRALWAAALAAVLAIAAVVMLSLGGGLSLRNVVIVCGMVVVVFLVGMSTTGFTVRDIVLIGLMAALVIVATLLGIPFGTAKIHLGSAALFTCALLLGGKRAGLAGGIGSALFDLVGGFSAYTPWSFAIKFLAGFCAGEIAQRGKWGFKRNLVAVIVGSVVTACGYFFAWWVIQGSAAAAVANLGATAVTSSIGIVASLLLAPLVRPALRGR